MKTIKHRLKRLESEQQNEITLTGFEIAVDAGGGDTPMFLIEDSNNNVFYPDGRPYERNH